MKADVELARARRIVELADKPRPLTDADWVEWTALISATSCLGLAEALAAIMPCADELLRLYDWRNKLAEECAAAEDKDERLAITKRQQADLRKYGAEKKAAWIALRAALGK